MPTTFVPPPSHASQHLISPTKQVYGGNQDAAVKTGAQFGIADPSLFISAMAAVTKNLTFGITQSVTYELPFTVARRFATLDHITNGRVGINIVTSYLASAAQNHGLEEQIAHDERCEYLFLVIGD